MRLRFKLLARVIVFLALFMGCIVLIPSLLELEQNDDSSANPHGADSRQRRELPLVSSNPIREKVGTPRPRPTQVLKPGVIGNFEPAYVHKDGPGEDGEPFHLPESKQAEVKKAIKDYGFNEVASKIISMDRHVLDTRPDECKYWHYAEDLPTVSVIVAFHNEGFWTLMRTIHSIKNNSPSRYLKEIVMVDDFSDKVELKDGLEKYLKQNFGDLVKLYRNTKREGLIRTRTLGATYATSEVIVFLDAHCECNRNWLVPLIARIAYDPTIMTVPVVDGIDHKTYGYYSVYADKTLYTGIFEWGFLYKELQLPEREKQRRRYFSEPYRSPTHAGGLLAINRDFFFTLGAYDPGLEIWGGENFELSFKVWQCGGSIEWVPCSHVGHVYRKRPYSIGNFDRKIPITAQNYMRVVEVWMDPEYKEYFYTRQPEMRGYPVGNLSAQFALKESLQCKPFKHFMDEIGYGLLDKFPPLPKNKAWGEVVWQNGTSSLCWDRGQKDTGATLTLYQCHHMGGNQVFRFNERGQIGAGERCIHAVGNTLRSEMCPTDPSGDFFYEFGTRLIRNRALSRCVEGESSGKELQLRACNPEDPKQKWLVKEVYSWK